MKRSGLIINYLTFVVLFLSLLIHSSGLVQAGKFALIILNAYFLYRITTERGKLKTMHKFNYLFVAATVVFVVYATTYRATLYPNLTLEFVIGALIGLSLSAWYKEGKKKRVEKQLKLTPPKKPQNEVKVVQEPVIVSSKPAKATKKKTTKKTAKKATKKKATKKTAKKSASKKTATKKSPAKKRTTKTAVKKTAKKTPTTKVAKKKVAKKAPAKKKVAKKAATKKTAKKSASKKTATKKSPAKKRTTNTATKKTATKKNATKTATLRKPKKVTKTVSTTKVY